MATLHLQQSGTADHPTFGPVNYKVQDIGWDADGQVVRTLGVMGRCVEEDAQDPEFQAWAYQVVGFVPGQGTDQDVIDAAYAHVKGAIQFTRDETNGAGIGGYPEEEVVELIIRPRVMAQLVAQGKAKGDCDDYTMYLAALLKVFGVVNEFCTVAADGRAPGNYSHVYLVAYPVIGGTRVRVPLDASHGEYAGWETENKFGRRTEWPVSGGCEWLGWVVAGAVAWWGMNSMKVRL